MKKQVIYLVSKNGIKDGRCVMFETLLKACGYKVKYKKEK